MDTLTRALAYLEKLPPAVSGSGGHNATLRAACECFRFGLSESETAEAMRWFNDNRCNPPWKDAELEHKIDDAEKIVRASGHYAVRDGRPQHARKARRTFQPPVIRPGASR